MQTYNIQIRVDVNYQQVECSGNTPCLLADQIRDLLRHEARGRAMDAYVAELREKVKIEYR